ncbi:MAG: hypothetical protein VSS75_011545 [Candidatus Parabeggiatoa sp.]|nr:hypothetical protein [Candidatus Parabeggiatoa sp.]
MTYKKVVPFVLCLSASLSLSAVEGENFQPSVTPVPIVATESQPQEPLQFPPVPQLPASEGGGPLFPDIDLNNLNRRLDAIEQNDAQLQIKIREQEKIRKLSKFFLRLKFIIGQNEAFINDFYTEEGYECIVGQQAANKLAQNIVELKQHKAFVQQECQGPMGLKAHEYCQRELNNVQNKISSFEQFRVEFENKCK